MTSVPPGPAGVPATPAAGAEVPARPTVTVATYPDYASAQRAIDYLSDNQFPVELTSIVGTDLRLVETVVGRMTTRVVNVGSRWRARSQSRSFGSCLAFL